MCHILRGRSVVLPWVRKTWLGKVCAFDEQWRIQRSRMDRARDLTRSLCYLLTIEAESTEQYAPAGVVRHVVRRTITPLFRTHIARVSRSGNRTCIVKHILSGSMIALIRQ